MGWKALHCIVFAVLLVVAGILYVRLSSSRADFEAANLAAESEIAAIHELAAETEAMSWARRAARECGRWRTGSRWTGLGMTRLYADPVRRDVHSSGGYETLSRRIMYADCSLEQLVALVYDIESGGLLRVSEMRWKLAGKRDNLEPPHHRVTRPVITIGTRARLVR